VDVVSFARGDSRAPNASRSTSSPTAQKGRDRAATGKRRSLVRPPAAATPPLREWIAARPRRRAGPCRRHERLAPGLRLPRRAARSSRGARVLVEAPTYDRPIKILRRLGAEIVGLPMDDEGLRPERAFEEALAHRAEAGVSCTRSRPSRTRAAAPFPRSAAAASSEIAKEARAVSCWRTIRTALVRYERRPGPVALRARGRRQRHVCVLVLEDGRAPASASAISCCRQSSRRRSRRSPFRRTSRRPFMTAGDGVRVPSVAGKLRVECRARERTAARAPRRDARGARSATRPRAPCGRGPRGRATSSGSTSSTTRRASPPRRPGRCHVSSRGKDFFADGSGAQSMRLAFQLRPRQTRSPRGVRATSRRSSRARQFPSSAFLRGGRAFSGGPSRRPPRGVGWRVV